MMANHAIPEQNQSYALLRLMPYSIFKLFWKCIYLSTKRTVPCRVWSAVLDQGGFIASSPIYIHFVR